MKQQLRPLYVSQKSIAQSGDTTSGQTVVWRNVDTTTHRVVLNDGSWIPRPSHRVGAFSNPMRLGAFGPSYCSIHPGMVGTLANQ